MLKITITTPDGLLFQGEADEVVVPTKSGMIGVRTNHLPLVSLLKPGQLEAKKDGGPSHKFQVREGYVKVGPQEVSVIARSARKA
ncbi:MAG: ATP synthase F1 subunit epsilon [bacterium]